MKVVLQKETPENAQSTRFLYHCLRATHDAATRERIVEFSEKQVTADPLQSKSTVIEWDGKMLYFDFSGRPESWNLAALQTCDIYFKSNLHRPTAANIIPQEILKDHQHKWMPFLSFAPDMLQMVKHRKIYKWLSKFQRFQVYHVSAVFANPLGENPGIPGGLNTSDYHNAIRNATAHALKNRGISSYSKLIPRAPGADQNTEYSSLTNPHLLRLKLIASDFAFVHLLPSEGLPATLYSGLAFDRPLILDHNPRVEQPYGFELKENEHFLSLFGDRYKDLSFSENSSADVLPPVSEKEFNQCFDALVDKMNSADLYSKIKKNVMDFRAQSLNAAQLSRCIEHAVKNGSVT